ncbi:MAG: hypothetical protein FVQ83_15900 [Chloroflexi bacterium]|nr:hypothetical protein [Chloroflexota bacterium]
MVQQIHTPYHNTSHRVIATAHLAQTMSLLRLNSEELSQEIEAELAKNPALEMIEERRCPTCHTKLAPSASCPKCSFKQTTNDEEPIVFISPPEEFSSYSNGNQELTITDNEFSSKGEDLPSYVLRQISSDLHTEERPIAAHILSCLDEDGLLPTPLSEVALYHHVSMSQVERVVNLIQRSDPIGVGAANSQAALLVQLETLGTYVPFPTLVKRTIEEGMELLGRRRYIDLGRLLGIPTNKAQKIAEFISGNLNPFPARTHWGSVRHQGEPPPQTYSKPDVIIRTQDHTQDTRLIVEILWPIRGILRINPLFQKALKEAPTGKTDQWKSDLEKANLLVKCLGQRNHTLVRLMQLLAVIQRDFILKGDPFIRPITRARLADSLGVHEATVSRAVSGKSVRLPSGKIIPISGFFDRSLHIRTAIKKIIFEEKVPLSDTKITKILTDEGHRIARRTVAKYRAMEGILPAHLRNQLVNAHQ